MSYEHPAFPQPINPSITEPDDPWSQGMGGLSVREYIAARAPIKMLIDYIPTDDIREAAKALGIEHDVPEGKDWFGTPEQLEAHSMLNTQIAVELAFRYADEFIKRSKR